MFRAEILWLANGPTLKMEGKLVGEWAEQARCLVTADVVPKGLVVDLTEVSYIDSAGVRLLSWLGVSAHYLPPAVFTQMLYAKGWAYRARREGAPGGMGMRAMTPQSGIPM